MLKELNDLNRPELVKDAVSAINSVIENIRRGGTEHAEESQLLSIPFPQTQKFERILVRQGTGSSFIQRRK